MKQCPSCQSQYSDVTLSFCLQDGTPLVTHVGQSTIDTVAFGNRITFDNTLPMTGLRAPSPDDSLWDSPRNSTAEGPKKSRSSLMVMAAVLPLFFIGIAGGGALWLYSSSRAQLAEKETVHPGVSDESRTEKISDKNAHPTVSETLKSQNSEMSPTTASIKGDTEATRQEITEFVTRWRETFEERKTLEYAAMYAAKVDYLGKSGVTPAEVKSEVKKSFDAFSEIEIEITNLLVAVDATGVSGSAVFDKEWSYEASSKLTDGKTHTKLHLLKADGEWKIISEKHLKVYFIEN